MTIKEAKEFIDHNLQIENHVDLRYAAMIMEDLFAIKNLDRVGTLNEDELKCLKDAIEKINKGVPLQYAVGVAHFYGRQFKVTKDVLIPRSETEELVFSALEVLSSRSDSKLDVLDVGTGSGCIAITLKKEAPAWNLTAMDVSVDALKVAAENARNLNAGIEFCSDDITDVKNSLIFQGEWDLIISNPPYISESEVGRMDKHVLTHEPHLALFPANCRPLEMYDAILRYGRARLREGGIICMELNEYLAHEIKMIALDHGFKKVRIIKDLQDKDRIIIGEKAD